MHFCIDLVFETDQISRQKYLIDRKLKEGKLTTSVDNHFLREHLVQVISIKNDLNLTEKLLQLNAVNL